MEIRVFSGHVPKESAEIRQAVFVDEQGFVDEFDEYDEKSTHLVLFEDDVAVATLRFYDEGGGSVHVGRVAVKKECRGRGYGKTLILAAFEIAEAEGFSQMTVGAQEDKAGFYETCGFKPNGPLYYEQSYPHLPLIKEF